MLLLTLDLLSPLERAAFLLHDVFDFPFAEVAMILGRSEAACRKTDGGGKVAAALNVIDGAERRGPVQSAAFEIEGAVIRALYVVRNPDKPRHVAVAPAGGASTP